MTTIVTTSMGRLEHLKVSLPTWLEHTAFQVLVVDYGCPDGTAAWVAALGDPRVRAIEVPPQLLSPTVDQAIFCKPAALNAALSELPSHERLVFLDADTLMLGPTFGAVAEALNADRFLVADPSLQTRDLTGVLAISAVYLKNIGGYDEGMRGWGAEDLDVRLRLFFSGLQPEWFPAGMLESIPHGDELRVAHYVEKDKEQSNRVNTVRIFQKLCTTLEEVARVVAHPTVRRLLGSGLNRSADTVL